MYRSWLFVPGNHEKNLRKVRSLQADVIIYDLEDAVPVDEKIDARQKVKKAIYEANQQVNFVRVNDLTTSFFIDDLDGVIVENLFGIVLPKVNHREDIIITDYLLGQMEGKHQLSKGSLKIVPLIETALGVQNIDEIVHASERILNLCFGAEDYMLDLNLEFNQENVDLMYARSQIVIASKAAGREAPIDSVYTNFKDEVGLEKEVKRAKQSGFQGKLVIHPKQIDLVNKAFSPTSKQIKEAKKIITLYNEALKSGKGAIQIDGKMVDIPIVEKARKILSQIEK